MVMYLDMWITGGKHGLEPCFVLFSQFIVDICWTWVAE